MFYHFAVANFLIVVVVFLLVIPGNRTYLLSQKRDSKSLDSGALYRQDYDDDDDSCNGAVSISNDNKKIMLPTPPIRNATVQQSTNQSEDENKMKASPKRNGDERSDDINEEKAQKQSTDVS